MQADEQSDPESQTTGFPGLRSWRAVYTLVTLILLTYIVLLSILTRMYK